MPTIANILATTSLVALAGLAAMPAQAAGHRHAVDEQLCCRAAFDAVGERDAPVTLIGARGPHAGLEEPALPLPGTHPPDVLPPAAPPPIGSQTRLPVRMTVLFPLRPVVVCVAAFHLMRGGCRSP